MVNLDTEVCVCNGVTAGEMAECIRDNNLKTLKEVLDNDILIIGDKCQACHDEGFHNDGINIPLILSMVEKKSI